MVGKFLCVLVALRFVYVSSEVATRHNNVCASFADYATIRTNKNCWYNPDVNAKAEAIAKRHGYRLEKHKVTTSDGYILGLHRLAKWGEDSKGTPVFFQHGICSTSVFWMLNGKTSPAFQLVDEGFDLWLGNIRGNDFSMRHTNLSTSDPKFWDFSFHEMAVYDVPAAIDYIREKTGRKEKITFIGHSMGTTISYIYSSILAEHAKNNVNMLISIAPVAYMEHIRTWLQIASPLYNVIKEAADSLGVYGSGQFPKIKMLTNNLCSSYPSIELCQAVVASILGSSIEEVTPEVLPVFFRRYPASFSLKSLAHYAQEIAAGGKFQWYDYGPAENLVRYDSVSPRLYEVDKIEIPVYLIYGTQDLISVEEDIIKLFSDLKCPKYLKLFKAKNNEISFSHNDFLYSKHITEFNKFLSSIIREASIPHNPTVDER